LEAEDIIKKHVKKNKIPGISVGLISETDTRVFNYGEIKKESGITPTDDTVYEILLQYLLLSYKMKDCYHCRIL